MSPTNISGFTFIKNGLTLGYPILESVLSIESICDEVIINVGFDDEACTIDDGTYKYLTENLTASKYVFLKSWWDPKIKSSGLILSEQTNIALSKCRSDFCLYIQGDECIHEDDLKFILEGVEKIKGHPAIDGLIFNYMHFYGNVDTYKYTRNLYRREVRLIKNHLGIKSWLDAQGFRKSDNSKMNATLISARIFHYGWARSEKVMKKKVKVFDTFYHGDNHERQNAKEFQYERNWGLKKFKQTHPKVMKNWIEKNKNPIDLMKLPMTLDWNVPGLVISDLIENLTGYRIGEFKNYRRRDS
jgi:glycosyltransferase involved in cell wall biosynthesis